MGPFRFVIPLLLLASVPAGFALGGWASFLTVGATPVALVSLDWLGGADSHLPPGDDHWRYRVLPWLYALLQISIALWAAWTIRSGRAGLLEFMGLTLSFGVASGVFGMVAAHDLIHSPRRADRGLGLIVLAFSGYMHFSIAHIHGHHRRAATWQDPASARLGESLFAFLPRSILGQWREAWALECRRLQRSGSGAILPANRLCWFAVVQLCVGTGFALMGAGAFAFWLVQAVLSVLLLEAFNYVAHYGLTRRERADGRPERMGPQHSWNASRRMNNASLFNMGRHADHHRSASRAYQALEYVDGGPELPCGYASALLLAFAPPLWRRVMDPRVLAQGR
jgi:alkane 1-monooxygenase